MAIKRLGRIWMKSGKDAASIPSRDDPSFDDFCPIDSQVQEEMVRSFERANDQQSLLWRTVFAAFLFCFVAFLLYSIVQQVSSPFELRYHAYFMEDVESWMIIAADWVAILACSFSIIGIVSKSNYHRRWLWCSFFISILLSVFWLYFMMRLPRFRWDVIWRPLGPLSGTGICLYVDHLLAESSEEIRKLRGYMYSYKAT
ncbi:uncharacterized protein LOC111785478 isoform X2 [Cucurbita pepo subsp. pepo]|uniref:uncharacterized protein LOC111780569 isoform X2 n=1 Tax=Cucurbita pepo subsp. pepo TaxID=3664 RepID=UPI000C9D4367|nr:uncharacterized protein LOC111780569 isoform X2 [Cucurbita pepo subsp. pepo]XP_023521642.1 uncharacterized protein LOC111785478 isoform X2 [Cucurbita pepo subsp. pepo]